MERHPITLAGEVFPHGFGTHSPGRFEIRLDGKATQFHAVVGIDDEVPVSRGSAEFLVYGSRHKLLFRSGIMRRGEKPKKVDLNLSGERTLLLVVSDAGDGFDYDHSDWADARIEYSGAKPLSISWNPGEPKIAHHDATAKPSLNGPDRLGIFPRTAFLWKVPAEGAAPLHYASPDLPQGLSLDENSGIITGSLHKVGQYEFHVVVSNASGTAQKTIELNVGTQLSLSPAMGWNSYDGFGDSVTEQETLNNAASVIKNLQPFGWDTVVVDYRWYDPGAHDNNPNGRVGAALAIDEFGRLLPAPNRFPSATDGHGFQALATKLHAQGLKFGIHIMRGIPRLAVNADMPIQGSTFTAAQAADKSDMCGWCPDMYGVRGDTEAGQAYYDSLFRLYASWGLDFVKMDDASQPYHKDEITAVHQAILKCGRSIVLSLSPGETPVSEAEHVSVNANQWRVSGDFWDNWGSLDHEFALAERWVPSVGPGHFPDADMLPLGRLSVGSRSVGAERSTLFTHAEQVTLISLWSLLPSPLMLGADVSHPDPWLLNLLTNREVLAVNQDTVSGGAHLVFRKDGVDVWVRKLHDGSSAVGVFNRTESESEVPLDWKAWGFEKTRHVRDLWQRKDSRERSVTIPAHGACLYRVS